MKHAAYVQDRPVSGTGAWPSKLQVLEVESFDGLITLRVAEKKHVLWQATASQIIVREFKGGE
ncbi:MAG: hypothetical protein ABSG63_14475 [Spirochaetia bacterium]|jgi:hypothetical protein